MNNRILIIISLLFGVLSLTLSLWLFVSRPRIAYIDTVRLFNEYKLKTDLETNEEGRLLSIRARADSLKALYGTLFSQQVVDTVKAAEIQMEMAAASRDFDSEYGRSNSEINQTVWKRLNPVIDRFAKDENVDLMLGANGMGTILYGENGIDYTDKMIKYANDSYKKGI
jgi:outer membrane protein